MADDPSEEDIFAWSEDQAARLRRVAAGEAPPDGAGVDWPGVIEEIESVGRISRFTVLTEFGKALRLVLMAYRWPDYQETGRWLAAADSAFGMASGFADASMEGRIDLEELYRKARELVGQMKTEGHAPRPLPAMIPLGFRDLRYPHCGSYEMLRRVSAAGEERP
jgi:hypothetical protein